MSGLCLQCYNQLHKSSYRENDVALKKNYCECCGQVKPCVTAIKPVGVLARAKIMWKRLTCGVPPAPASLAAGVDEKQELHGRQEAPLTVQTAYIRMFGAASAARDELEPVRSENPRTNNAYRILDQAIHATEDYLEIALEKHAESLRNG